MTHMNGMVSDEDVGKVFITLCFSPKQYANYNIRAVLPKGTNPEKIASSIDRAMRGVLNTYLGDRWEYGFNDTFKVTLHPSTAVIKSASERSKEFLEGLASLSEVFEEADEKRLENVKENPDNGKEGWWRVSGIRHSAVVRASSAEEAIDKADSAGLVAKSWESPEAHFWTKDLPDAFSC